MRSIQLRDIFILGVKLMSKRFITAGIASVLLCAQVSAPMHAQSFSDFGFGKKKEEKNNTGGKIAGAGAGCAAAGAIGYFGTKAVGGFLEKQGYARKEIEQAAIGAAALGCVIGGAAAVKIIDDMDEKSKQAQEDAWVLAQSQTGPVDWSGPDGTDYAGTVELIELEEQPGGKKCGTRKDYVTAGGGDAEAYTRVCQNDQGKFEKVDV